jgi:hypothetical protein
MMRELFAICYDKSDHILAASQSTAGRRPDLSGHRRISMSGFWHGSLRAMWRDGRHGPLSRSTNSLTIGTAKMLLKLTRAI